MNKLKITLVALGIIVLVLPTGLMVVAQENNQEAAEQRRAARQERIQQRKDNLQLRLGQAQLSRLEDRCQNAQGKLRSTLVRVNGIKVSREQVHSNLVDRLTNASAKLQASNVNVTDLDKHIATLQANIEEFQANLEAHQEALLDLADMDCQADPEGFKASLETARASQQSLREDTKTIKTFLNETMKPLLNSVRSNLDNN